MKDNIAFLELKYGTIYGGVTNFFVTSEVSLLVFNPFTMSLSVDNLLVDADVDVVFVSTQVNELGHTLSRTKYVTNLATRKRKFFQERYKINKTQMNDSVKRLRAKGNVLKEFMDRALVKHKVGTLVTFDGKRDISLCKKARVNFDDVHIFDIQKQLSKETNYLFSLNKLSVITNFQKQGSKITSNNLEYSLPKNTAHLFNYGTAAYDAARMFMLYQEYNLHRQDFMIKAAILVNKIMKAKREGVIQ